MLRSAERGRTARPFGADWRRVATIVRGLERWLLPSECLLCGGATASAGETLDDPLVCNLCRARWRLISDPVCTRCGEPLELDESCRRCANWPDGLARVRSAVCLEEGARLAVHRLKYDGWWRVTDAMADRMTRLDPLTPDVSLIPVPLAARRERRRGYNQSERLATALGTRLGRAIRTDVLRRIRETPSQTALTPDERRANVAGAFTATRAQGLRAVLVDDVFTTGATLLAAAEALLASGAERVEAVTFARAAG